jgi:hypothetical protein
MLVYGVYVDAWLMNMLSWEISHGYGIHEAICCCHPFLFSRWVLTRNQL